MSKKIGNVNLTKEVVEGLKGFEDVFSDYLDSEEYKDQERRDRESGRAQEQYELQHFLEQENERLTGLEIFLTKKVSLKTNFSQTEKLMAQQRERKKQLKDRLALELKKPESHLQKNLSQMFNAHFS